MIKSEGRHEKSETYYNKIFEIVEINMNMPSRIGLTYREENLLGHSSHGGTNQKLFD